MVWPALEARGDPIRIYDSAAIVARPESAIGFVRRRESSVGAWALPRNEDTAGRTSGAGLRTQGLSVGLRSCSPCRRWRSRCCGCPMPEVTASARPNDRRQRPGRPARETNTPSLATQPRRTSPSPPRAGTRVLSLRLLSRRPLQRGVANPTGSGLSGSVRREALTHPEQAGRRQVCRPGTMRGKWTCPEAAHVPPRRARAYAILGLRGPRPRKMHFPARAQPDVHATGEIERRLTASGEGWSKMPRSLRPTFASG